MKARIPEYRAETIDRKKYATGYLSPYINDDGEACRFENLIIISEDGEMKEIDISTLSIHFPDMFDSQGTKIFASLSEDGKGGSLLYDSYNKYYMYVKYNNGKILMPVIDCEALTNRLDYRTQVLDMHIFIIQNTVKVVGIQQ